MVPRCHDLIRLSEAGAIPRPLPEWAEFILRETLYAVVRRSAPRPHTVPVGIRGRLRTQRWAAHAAETAIAELITPEDLARSRGWRNRRKGEGIAALHELESVGDWLDEQGYVWGPIGAVGFELASGWPATTASSDLDILIRAPLPLGRAGARAILRGLERFPVRSDVQLDTPAGLVSLAEVSRGGAFVLARGAGGVRLIDDPWGKSGPLRSHGLVER